MPQSIIVDSVQVWVSFLPFPFISCVTLEKLFNLSLPQFCLFLNAYMSYRIAMRIHQDNSYKITPWHLFSRKLSINVICLYFPMLNHSETSIRPLVISDLRFRYL